MQCRPMYSDNAHPKCASINGRMQRRAGRGSDIAMGCDPSRGDENGGKIRGCPPCDPWRRGQGLEVHRRQGWKRPPRPNSQTRTHSLSLFAVARPFLVFGGPPLVDTHPPNPPPHSIIPQTFVVALVAPNKRRRIDTRQS